MRDYDYQQYPEPEEKQPEEWEEVLKDVTVEKHWREQSFDPAMLAKIQETYYENPLQGARDVFHDDICLQQIELVRQVADHKLKGLQRKCVLFYLSTGLNYKKLAKILKVSDDTVSRQIKRAIPKLQSYFKDWKPGEFPSEPKTRPVVRSALFPLDNGDERKDFQKFLNGHVALHVSYSKNGRFREALVVYLTGKTVNHVPAL